MSDCGGFLPQVIMSIIIINNRVSTAEYKAHASANFSFIQEQGIRLQSRQLDVASF